MRVVLIALVTGCSALTGASDLELVDCVDCEDTAVADTGVVVDTTSNDTGSLPDNSVTQDSTPELDTAVPVDAMPETKACTMSSECDDMNPCTLDRCPGTTNICTHTITDRDGDGEAPSTAGACGTDCNDNNKDVFSKQTVFFTSGYTTGLTVSFDYNCDGKQEPQYPTVGKCTVTGALCTVTDGWQSSVPACGKSGKYITACAKTSFGCIPNGIDRVQPCR